MVKPTKRLLIPILILTLTQSAEEPVLLADYHLGIRRFGSGGGSSKYTLPATCSNGGLIEDRSVPVGKIRMN